jgi:MFS transporter, PHS family, inorganic phosphate transporter
VFPTRYRATAHGISAAAGKSGAIVSALAFNALSLNVGVPAVLWSTFYLFLKRKTIIHEKRLYLVFFGCCIAGAALSLLLPEAKGRDPDRILMDEMHGIVRGE